MGALKIAQLVLAVIGCVVTEAICVGKLKNGGRLKAPSRCDSFILSRKWTRPLCLAFVVVPPLAVLLAVFTYFDFVLLGYGLCGCASIFALFPDFMLHMENGEYILDMDIRPKPQRVDKPTLKNDGKRAFLTIVDPVQNAKGGKFDERGVWHLRIPNADAPRLEAFLAQTTYKAEEISKHGTR